MAARDPELTTIPGARPEGRPQAASIDLEAAARKLEAYCRTRDWAGFDPYDALNSELFARTPLAKSRIARLAFTQFLKRSPVNLRPMLGIRPQQDPKATALFLMSYVKRARCGDEASGPIAGQLASRLSTFARRGRHTGAGATVSHGRRELGSFRGSAQPRLHDVRGQRASRRLRDGARHRVPERSDQRGRVHRE